MQLVDVELAPGHLIFEWEYYGIFVQNSKHVEFYAKTNKNELQTVEGLGTSIRMIDVERNGLYPVGLGHQGINLLVVKDAHDLLLDVRKTTGVG